MKKMLLILSAIAIQILIVMTGVSEAQLYATGGGLYTVDPATGQATYVGGPTCGCYWQNGGLAYDSANGTLYATGYNNASRSALFSVDPTTGNGQQVGVDYAAEDINFSSGGLAYDSLHNILYATGHWAQNPVRQSMTLFTINPLNGSATPVGSFGHGIYLYGLGYDPIADTLYANGYNLFELAYFPAYSTLYTVDRGTGLATRIGFHGVTLGRQLAYGGLAVDPMTQDLLSIGSVTASASGLYRLDRATGAATLIGIFNAYPYNPGADGGLAFVPPVAEPVADSQSLTTPEDTPLAITLTGSDPDPLTFSVAGGPSSGTLTGTPPNLTYTPNANFNGADSFTFTVSDGSLTSAPATVSITVTAVNDPPTAYDESVTTAEDTSVSIALSATDPDSGALTLSIVSGPSHGTLSYSGGLTYTPAPNYNGPDSFTFKANDGLADSNVATASITVTPVNDHPVATGDAARTVEGIPVTIDVLANDTDVDGDALTVVSVTQGANGMVVIKSDGTVSYTPNNNFAGTDTFTYTVADGKGGSATAPVAVTVASAGGGQSKEVDAFLSYVSPLQGRTDLPAGTTGFNVTIVYGATINPATFQASLNGAPFAGFNPVAGTSETLTIPLAAGRNVLLLQVDGVISSGRTATDRDRLTFIVR